MEQPMTTTSKLTEPVVFLDLAALHAPLREGLEAVWQRTLTDSSFIGGPAVAAFEERWADYCGVGHCVGVANGTDALELVLTALEIGPGDEVIVPANTFVATAEAVLTAGATPVFVDVDPGSLLITAEAIAEAVNPATRAVMVVHLYGQIPDMEAILAVTDDAGIHLVEDAAQAHGATHRGRRAGSFGIAATFSFYPGKNLGALGDGGAIVTDDHSLTDEIRTRANHGRGTHLLHTHAGRNSRLDGLQAAVLDLKLDHLDGWNEHRRKIHGIYVERLGGAVELLETLPEGVPVHHLEVIRVEERDRLALALAASDIHTGIHYALPCHKHPAFAQFDPGPLPVAEHAANHQLSLPMHPTLTASDANAVADAVLEHT
jgi:dTDP-4-amino-4,6-dideoxygalactose transaminase